VISQVAAGVGGFMTGIVSAAGYPWLRRRRQPQRLVAHELRPEVAATIERAAKEWAKTQSNPYAEQVARPWAESFVRTGVIDERIILDHEGGASG
jgi:hypothetical protein